MGCLHNANFYFRCFDFSMPILRLQIQYFNMYQSIFTLWYCYFQHSVHTRHILPTWVNTCDETDQAVWEGEGVFGQQLHHVWITLLRLIGEPGTPHVLTQGGHDIITHQCYCRLIPDVKRGDSLVPCRPTPVLWCSLPGWGHWWSPVCWWLPGSHPGWTETPGGAPGTQTHSSTQRNSPRMWIE